MAHTLKILQFTTVSIGADAISSIYYKPTGSNLWLLKKAKVAYTIQGLSGGFIASITGHVSDGTNYILLMSDSNNSNTTKTGSSEFCAGNNTYTDLNNAILSSTTGIKIVLSTQWSCSATYTIYLAGDEIS